MTAAFKLDVRMPRSAAPFVAGPGVRKFWRRMWSHPRSVGVRESESAIYAIGAGLVVFFQRLNTLRAAT